MRCGVYQNSCHNCFPGNRKKIFFHKFIVNIKLSFTFAVPKKAGKN